MRFYLAFLTFISLLIYSCSDKEKEIKIPENIINKQTMSSIVVELSLLESARSHNLLHKLDSARGVSLVPDIPKYQEIIFDKYGVTRQQYDSSFSFYSRHPQLLIQIFEEAGNEISQMQAKLSN